MRFSSVVAVTVAATATALAALDDIKLELSITDGSADALLTLQIAQASAAIERYCRRRFAQETVTETLRADRGQGYSPSGSYGDGEWPERLQLARYPVSAVQSVTVDDGSALTADVDYELDGSTGQLLRIGPTGLPLWWHNRKILVGYTAGYVLPAGAPADLSRATIDLVKTWWFVRSRDPLLSRETVPDVASQQWGGRGIENPDGLPIHVTALIDQFCDPAFI